MSTSSGSQARAERGWVTVLVFISAAAGVSAADPASLEESDVALQAWVGSVLALAESRSAAGEPEAAVALLALAHAVASTSFDYTGHVHAERGEFAAALEAARPIEDEADRVSALGGIADLEVDAGLGARAVETAEART